MRTRAAKARRGITLVEVLATLVLIGVVLPAVMHAVSMSLHAAAWARHQQEATMLAEHRLSEILATADPAAYSGMGDFGPEWPEYRWQAEYSVVEFGLFETSVTVTWAQRGQERSVVLSTLVFPGVEESFGGGF
jgi:general secretion pathway protein I